HHQQSVLRRRSILSPANCFLCHDSSFLRRDDHHRDLHSFPTRRSSDLPFSAAARKPGSSLPWSCVGIWRKRVAKLPIHNGKLDPDRKSTRLNSSHLVISYAVFCLKKKKTIQIYRQ